MKHSPLWQLPVVLALLLLASCNAEMPVTNGLEVTPRTTHHRALPPQQVPQRLGSLWASLPHTSATRAGEDPTPDSLFTVPSGDFVGTYEPGTDTWMQNPDIDQIDTLSTYAYVVTFKEQPGFVILSAVEGIPDVLFYTEESTYNGAITDTPTTQKSGFHSFMDLMTAWVWYKLSVGPEDDGGPIDPPYRDSGWKSEHALIGGTGVPVMWGQGHPYNILCYDKKGRRALTGCVATAVAQAMAYYKYPASYNGHTFHWDEMLGVYSWCSDDNEYAYSQTGSEQGWNDVAFLMRSLGYAGNLNMNYGVDGSSANCKYIYQTFHNFGYAGGGTQNSFNYEKMMNEIDEGRPIIMEGYDRSDMGHAWVIDGYVTHFKVRTYKNGKTERVDRTDLVHCNWGWCGYNNGYAVANVFDPYENFSVPPEWMVTRSQSATAYCRKTKMYINITPN